MDEEQQQQNPAIEDETQAAAAPASEAQPEADASQDGSNPTAESGNKAAAEEEATAEKVKDVNGYIAQGMEKVGGKAGKYIGKALTVGSDLSVEGMKARNAEMGDYDNKTVSDENGDQTAQRQTVSSVAADKMVDANLKARALVGKVTDNETVKSIAGHTAAVGRGVAQAGVDTVKNVGAGVKSYATKGWNRLKEMAGVGNP